MHRRIFGTSLAAAWMLSGAPLAANPRPSPEIADWIAQLDSDSYQDREQASEKLAAAGKDAVASLESAAAGRNPEVMLRSIETLTQLAAGGDRDTENAAEAALERLSDGPNASASSMAGSALLRHRQLRQQNSIAEIRRLGGIVVAETSAWGDETAVQVQLGGDWSGGDDSVAMLKRLPDLRALSLRGTPITDEALDSLCSLKNVTTMEVFGTGLSDQGLQRFAQALPNATIDRRAGALLGVAGTAGAGVGCYILTVQEESAADNAGLKPGDVILTFAGTRVKDFPELTALVGQKTGGEKVELDVFRGGKIMTKNVTLGSWK